MSRLTVVIPTREKGLPPDNITLVSLCAQSFSDFLVVVQADGGRGANWARNAGFKLVDSELVLFCDDDINWHPSAFEKMIACLDAHPQASYVYCGYEMGGKTYCMRPFSAAILRSINYISTMSILRTVDFPGFDENITRFQDWDLWLTLLEQEKTGIWCGELLFETKVRNGITFNGDSTAIQATFAVKRKHKL